MQNLLYTQNSIIGRLKKYFFVYFENISYGVANSIFSIILSMIVLESADSIRSLHRHFIANVTKKSLTALYYACSYANVDYSNFMKITVAILRRLVPDDLKSHPIFICIDDTMVEKSGTKFEEVATLFDHAAHNGTNYLNGHCFVSLMVCVPVWNNGMIQYLSAPVGYRMWKKAVSESKLSLAANMVRTVMPELYDVKNVIILCDSWYPKDNLICVLNEFKNLNMICNVRKDSAMYSLPPAPTGRRGRPRKYGDKLNIATDFRFSDEKVNGFYVSTKVVVTKLFGDRQIYAFVTANEKESESRRLFFSTICTEDIEFSAKSMNKEHFNTLEDRHMDCLPMILYEFRWSIEVSYYEQKTFWSLCSYMVRSSKGIELMLNIITITYSAMKILPYQDQVFSKYRKESPQEVRMAIGEKIRNQVFYARLGTKLETSINSEPLKDAVNKLFYDECIAA